MYTDLPQAKKTTQATYEKEMKSIKVSFPPQSSQRQESVA